MEEAMERYQYHIDGAKEAFDELCAMVNNFMAEREEKHAAAMAKFEAMKVQNSHLREKNRRLKERYIVALDMYNTLAEESKERSDSSSSSSEDESDDCTLM